MYLCLLGSSELWCIVSICITARVTLADADLSSQQEEILKMNPERKPAIK